MQKIEVIFTPALYPYRTMNGGHITVVNDILRATTSICTALRNGAKALIPVSTIEEARKYKQRGFLVAGERIEQTFEFADWGNSALEFTKERVEGKEIVHSTTNVWKEMFRYCVRAGRTHFRLRMPFIPEH